MLNRALSVSDVHLSVNAAPYFLSLDLYEPVQYEHCHVVLSHGALRIILRKTEAGVWPGLLVEGDVKEIADRRKKSIEAARENHRQRRQRALQEASESVSKNRKRSLFSGLDIAHRNRRRRNESGRMKMAIDLSFIV
jgi:hypothetical protein